MRSPEANGLERIAVLRAVASPTALQSRLGAGRPDRAAE